MSHDVQGIYQIKNLRNDKIYIGSSKKIYKRWYTHKRLLRNNKHDNPHLQAAWNKYGEEYFKFSILEVVPDVSLLLEKETEWILKLESIGETKGYNIDVPTQNEKRYEFKEKVNSKQVGKPIILVDSQTGTILKRYERRQEAQTDLGLTERQVGGYVERNCLSPKTDKSKLLHPLPNQTILMYEEFYNKVEDFKSAIKSGELIKVWAGDSFIGTLTRYEVFEHTGVITDYMWQRLRTKSKSGTVEYKGFTLEFLTKGGKSLKTKQISSDTPKEITGIKDGKIVETYSTLQEMAEKLNITYKMTTRLLSNSKKKKRRKGVTYQYK